MAGNLPAALRAPDAVLVPVPALPARRRARGFDPARVLPPRSRAASIARSPTAWRRGGRGSSQVGAGRSARRAPGRIPIRVRGSPPPLAILVDDVHTTGATLDACARALVADGARVLAAVSYARTL